MNIKKALYSGETVRFHNHNGIDKQPVSTHQWGVALIVQHLSPECSKELILAAMVHDAAEYWTGDVPAPVKWTHPEVKPMFDNMEERWMEANGLGWEFDLTDEEKRILKIADTMEGMWFCIQQVKVGHKSARRPFRKWSTKLSQLIQVGDPTPWFEMLGMLIDEMGKWK